MNDGEVRSDRIVQLWRVGVPWIPSEINRFWRPSVMYPDDVPTDRYPRGH